MKRTRMKAFIGLICLVCMAFASCDSVGGGMSRTSSLSNEEDSISYAVGLDLGNTIKTNLVDNGVAINRDVMVQAMADALEDKEDLLLDDEGINTMLVRMQQKASSQRQQKLMEQAEENMTEGKTFLEENKNAEGVVELESGLQYKVLESGSGESPEATDRVSVHYEGKLLNGEVFDSSYERGTPQQLAVNQVIPGWTEALQMMKPGDKWELYIPSELGYGQRGSLPVIGPNSTLIFQVELLEVLGEGQGGQGQPGQ